MKETNIFEKLSVAYQNYQGMTINSGISEFSFLKELYRNKHFYNLFRDELLTDYKTFHIDLTELFLDFII